MHASSGISIIYENGVYTKLLKNHVIPGLIFEELFCDYGKTIEGNLVQFGIVFIVYCTKPFMIEAVKHLCEHDSQLRIFLFYNCEFKIRDLSEISMYTKHIIGWSHTNLDDCELEFIIKNALKGNLVLGIFKSPFECKHITNNDQSNKKDNSQYKELLSLTDREIEVLLLIAEGATNKMIADTLFISENTAKTHVRRILGKLQFSSRTKAALYAIESGLIRNI